MTRPSILGPHSTRAAALAGLLVLGGCVAVIPTSRLGSGGSGDASAVDVPTNVAATRGETDALRLVNAQRRASGRGALAADPRVQAAAEAHSRWMASTGRLSHRGAGGTDMLARLRAAGYRACGANENIYKGRGDAAAAVGWWMSSPGHARNIRAGGVSEGAVASARDAAGNTYWTMVAARPC